MFVITPERADSAGNGTRIFRAKSAGFAASLGATAKSQSPFKLTQLLLTICGLGYSGSTFCGLTSLAQRVMSGAFAGCHSAGAAKTLVVNNRPVRKKGVFICIGRAQCPHRAVSVGRGAEHPPRDGDIAPYPF